MRKLGKKGFSLVEVLTIIAIIAIIGAIAYINLFRTRDNQNLRAAALEVEGDIAEARSRALSRNREYRITFTVGTANYVIEECAAIGMTCGGGGFNVIQAKTLPAANAATTFNSANFGGANWIRFQMRGTADLGTVVIQNTNGSTATVTTNFRARTYVTYAF